jgi:hypothetical protein
VSPSRAAFSGSISAAVTSRGAVFATTCDQTNTFSRRKLNPSWRQLTVIPGPAREMSPRRPPA